MSAELVLTSEQLGPGLCPPSPSLTRTTACDEGVVSPSLLLWLPPLVLALASVTSLLLLVRLLKDLSCQSPSQNLPSQPPAKAQNLPVLPLALAKRHPRAPARLLLPALPQPKSLARTAVLND